MSARDPVQSIWYYPHVQQETPIAREILTALERQGLDVALLDGRPTAGPGLFLLDNLDDSACDALRRLSHDGQNRVIAIETGRESLTGTEAWTLLEAGASDAFAWNGTAEAAAIVAARFARWAQVDMIVDTPMVRSNLVGRSVSWLRVLRRIVEVACFTDVSMLITGESGTGKEMIARLLHTLDRRTPKQDLVVVDCTTVVRELSGSEFFGHEKGAFTNAVSSRDGAFALANGGTLFLDEVGELPTSLQAELLRAVQERTYKRVGSNEWKKISFRLICATNRDLLEEEARGNFRRDFYYRIASWVCHLPPLRDRLEDILPLVHHFMSQALPGREPPGLDDAVKEYFLTREYPGNIRDLKQLIARILCRHVGPGPITPGDIPEEDRPASGNSRKNWSDEPFENSLRRALALGIGLKEIGRAATDTAIGIALDDEEGNIQRAARRLGITDRALQMRRAEKRNGGLEPFG